MITNAAQSNDISIPLRSQFCDQFFIYHDFLHSPHNKKDNKFLTELSFEQWLRDTNNSLDKDECFSKMRVVVAASLASLLENNRYHESSHSDPATSVAFNNELSRMNSPPRVRTSKHPIASMSSRKQTTTSVISQSTSTTSSTASYLKHGLISPHSSVSSSSHSTSTSSKSHPPKIRTDTTPHPSTARLQDIAFFNLKCIEQPCEWPTEYHISTDNLRTFVNMIHQKVEQVCKSTHPIIPDPTLDEISLKRFEFEGQTFSATIGWDPYQTYCGIMDCNCEKLFKMPHFYYDVLSIDRKIPYHVLIGKDTENEEQMKTKEELYQKMTKANTLGKKIWPDSRNRVSQLQFNTQLLNKSDHEKIPCTTYANRDLLPAHRVCFPF